MGRQSLGLSLVSPPLWRSIIEQFRTSLVSTDEALCASLKTRSAHSRKTASSSALVSEIAHSCSCPVLLPFEVEVDPFGIDPARSL